MPGFTSYDDLINEVTTNSKIFTFDFFKVGTAANVAGGWHSLARLVGYPAAITDGAVGSGTPGAGGTALTSASGTISMADKSTDIKALITFAGMATQSMNLMLYDRLNHTSGIVLNSTGTKNVGSPALGRYTTGIGVQAWIEFTTAGTTTANIINMNSYTDDGGNNGSVGGSITAPVTGMVANSMLGPLPIAAGDLGIKSVETINVGTASTAGVGQLFLMKPLAVLPLAANAWVEKDFVLQFTSLPLISDGASLCLAYQATGTSAANIWGNLRIAWG